MVTAVSWKVNADGDWSTAADWSSGAVPNSADAVTISTANVHAVTYSGGSTTINKLTVGQDVFTLSGGSLAIQTTASFADGYNQTGGTLTTGAVSVTGAAQLLGGGSSGATAFTVSGVTTLSGYTLGGSSKLTVSTTANQTGQVVLGDATGVNAAINTAAAGVYDIAGDFSLGGGAASALFTNAGTLEKGSGSGSSTVGVSMHSTGTLSAASGTLAFSGPTNTISGTLSGAGQIAFAGGVTTLGALTASVGGIDIFNAATVNLAANLTYAHAFNDASNGVSTLNLGATHLTLSGASANFVGGNGSDLITGSGAFTDSAAVTTFNDVVVGGTVRMVATKTINQTGNVTFGDGAGGAPSLAVNASAIYDFTTDSSLSENGATVALSNLGLLEKTGTGGASGISLAVTSSGTIAANVGTLDFSNTLVNTGAISGAGTVQITGTATLNTGTALTVANFDLNNSATLNLGANLTYAGVFADNSNGNTTLNLSSHILTLTGASNSVVGANGAAFLEGTGQLANKGTLSLGDAVVDGTVQLDNTGTVNQNANATIGGSGGQVASIVNAAGAHYNLAGDFTLGNGAATASHFDNSGTFAVQGGIGTATLSTTFNNLAAGVLNVATGGLQTTGALVNAGTVSGVRLAVANSGVATLNAGSKLTVGELDLFNSATIVLDTALTYAGTFVDSSNGNTTLTLHGANLTLTGASQFAAANGVANVNGTGTLLIQHAASFSGGTTVIGGTARLNIGAVVTSVANLQLGDGGATAASAVIAAAGTYDITADVGIQRGASAASTLTNNGLFEKTAGTGVTVISADFVNNGTVTVTSGTIEFLAGTLTNHGTINGTMSTDGSGNIFYAAVAPGAVKAGPGKADILTAAQPAAAQPAAASLARAAQVLTQAAAGFAVDTGAIFAAPIEGVAAQRLIAIGVNPNSVHRVT